MVVLRTSGLICSDVLRFVLQIFLLGLRKVLLIIVLSSLHLTLSSQAEICDNGIDDDADSLVDLNDDDCVCNIVEPVSVIPNPSFEDQNCCPSERSQLDCASEWIQASEPTTDYINTCDWLGWDDFPPPQPFPDGEGVMGFRDGRVRGNNDPEPFWKEYAGACLLSPLLKDSSYRFQFDLGFVDPERSPDIDISFFGTGSCDNLPFGVGNDAFGCPSNSPSWKKLGEVRVSGGGGNRWIRAVIEAVPDEDIYAMAIGPDCNAVSSPISIYYYFDNLLLANIESFDFEITEEEHPCSSAYTLSVPFNPEVDYQWYKDGVALNGEVFSGLTQNYGEGSYQVRVLDGSSCRVSAKFEYVKPSFSTSPRVSICNGDAYRFGDAVLTESGFYLDTLVSRDNCDSIVALDLEVIGDQFDTLEATILAGETYEIGDENLEDEGAYPLVFTSSLGCDSLVYLTLTHFNLYIPNIFSPNFDTINDVFYPSAPVGEIESVDIQIFNRWGGLIFQGSEWDGRDQQPGVYVYLVNVDFSNDTSKTFYGSVTLIK